MKQRQQMKPPYTDDLFERLKIDISTELKIENIPLFDLVSMDVWEAWRAHDIRIVDDHGFRAEHHFESLLIIRFKPQVIAGGRWALYDTWGTRYLDKTYGTKEQALVELYELIHRVHKVVGKVPLLHIFVADGYCIRINQAVDTEVLRLIQLPLISYNGKESLLLPDKTPLSYAYLVWYMLEVYGGIHKSLVELLPLTKAPLEHLMVFRINDIGRRLTTE